VATGRFGSGGQRPSEIGAPIAGDEIHVHLLSRDGEGAERVLRDLAATMENAATQQAEPKVWRKPVQLELLAA
jgi:hypothetical protein